MPVLKTWGKNNKVKFWVESHDSPDPKIDQSKIVGFFMPVLNNIQLAEKVYESFINSMPLNYPFGLIVLDGGSDDGTFEYFQEKCVTYSNVITSKEVIPENITGLCKGTDEVAIRMLLGNYKKDEDRFAHEGDFGYIGYLHTDMEFRTVGWAKILVDICEKDEDIGIIGPRTEQNESMEEEFKFANVSPFIMPTRVVKDHYKNFGYLFDPQLWFQVGYCDWDLHLRNMVKLGYKSLVYRHVFVSHPMCGTRVDLHRKDPRRNSAFEENKRYWCKKWGLVFDDDPFKKKQRGELKVERTV